MYKPFVSPIWNQTIAQIGSEYPQIVHAFVGASAIQACYQSKFVDNVHDRTAQNLYYFTLEQQNKAIALSRNEAIPDDVMVLFCLLACKSIICFLLADTAFADPALLTDWS